MSLLKNLLLKNAGLVKIDNDIDETEREIQFIESKLKNTQKFDVKEFNYMLKLKNLHEKLEHLKNVKTRIKKSIVDDGYSSKRKLMSKKKSNKKSRSRKKSKRKSRKNY